MATSDRVPVIVGIGEAIDRPFAMAMAKEPLRLMADAARQAGDDAGGALLSRVDAVDIVNVMSWRYADLEGALCRALDIAPRWKGYHPVGGESPVRLVHEAALRIARGESEIALVVGAEAQHSATRAKREGEALPWTAFASAMPAPLRGADIVHPLAVRHGLATPTQVYPLFEMASAASWGQSPADARAESAELWARYAAVAAANPRAWVRKRPEPAEIVTPSEANRLIAWPYTKLMVANPLVNQGAAVIVTSLAVAREAGIAAERLVDVVGGAAASEPRDFLARDSFAASPAQDAVLAAAAALAPDGFDALELYSCFPCVPKMARRSLGLGPDLEPSVTGGLTFFGGPLSVYMLHAICAMTRRLRAAGGAGLLYGQGEFVTKHRALVLGKAAQGRPPPAQDHMVQADADRRRGRVPPLVEPTSGPATLETATIVFRRDGGVEHGVAVLRTADGARTLALVPADDRATLARITDDARFPIGLDGMIAPHGDAMAWRAEGA